MTIEEHNNDWEEEGCPTWSPEDIEIMQDSYKKTIRQCEDRLKRLRKYL